jgi:hypothetical protein
VYEAVPWLLGGVLLVLVGEGLGLMFRLPVMWLGLIPLTDRPIPIREVPRQEEGQTPSVDWWMKREDHEGAFVARPNEGMWRLRGVVRFHKRATGPVELELLFTPAWSAVAFCLAAGGVIGLFGYPGLGAVFGLGCTLLVYVGYSKEAKKVAAELRFDWNERE